jgi:hypothetical protein
MRRIPSSATVLLLTLMGGACLVERWLAVRTARAQRPRVPTEHWENEGGALAPPPFPSAAGVHSVGIATSQVPL